MVAARAGTLREALQDFCSLQPGYSRGAVVYLSRLGADYCFGYGIYDRSSAGARQLYDCVLAFGRHVIAELTKGQVEPVEVLYCHREPDDLTPYRSIMKAPLRFNQDQAGLVIAGTKIDYPLPHPEPEERARITRRTKAALGIEVMSAAAKLRHVLRPQLLVGEPSMQRAAKLLGEHPRTLRRHLATEGLTYETVRDQVRFVLARELLDLTDLPISEVSAALSFANHAGFVRAFRRWSGMTPTQHRSRGSKG